MSAASVRVALVGCGRWGEKLLRALSENARARVIAVADVDRGRLSRARALAPRARLVRTIDEALAARVDAVVIATPAASHAELALRALEAGADVFVEKPLALSAAQADRCASRAAALGRIGMVGHLLRYHPSVVRLVALARERRLGDLVSFSAARLSMSAAGGVGGARSALWTLGPHDLSLLSALDSSPLAEARAHLSPCGELVTLEARLESGLAARIELCSSSPTKERRLRLVGSAGVAVFDDVRAPDRILFLDARGAAAGAPAGERASHLELAPAGRELEVPWREPLSVEIEHFLRCVEDRAPPLTPLDEGAAVVTILERVEATLAPVDARVVAAG
ncbi:Gfo/Idh/MocA family protein [Sorangium atrum]|uniref:Gfo/Idh/MocA family oxidoreductase n=1 Tax=Sorangium atrum TaxID=2995308 RepID=A0ABT5CGN2_9BACT|nr:Gfo/Idh/MocA family oxidoreductase [Sorangium aterium]MDC0684292.1 Gfo/Idh/MocA family oxidoreductase [Sorangium aterium]